MRFVCYYESFNELPDEKQKHFPEMNDENWLSTLMFLTDINTHSNKKNKKLQNKCEIVLDLLRY